MAYTISYMGLDLPQKIKLINGSCAHGKIFTFEYFKNPDGKFGSFYKSSDSFLFVGKGETLDDAFRMTKEKLVAGMSDGMKTEAI